MFWNDDEVTNVRRLLHDANFFISRARVRTRNRNYDEAWKDVGGALALKRLAIGECPELHGKRGLLSFDELYRLFELKDFVLLAAAWNVANVEHFGIHEMDRCADRLRESAQHIRDFGKQHWPAPHPCAAAFDEVGNALVAHAIAVGAPNPNPLATQQRVRNAQEALLRCLYPNAEPDMADFYWRLFWMDQGLMDAYNHLKFLVPTVGARDREIADKAIASLEWAERRKQELLDMLERIFPTQAPPPAWDPAPDRLPWPPADHG